MVTVVLPTPPLRFETAMNLVILITPSVFSHGYSTAIAVGLRGAALFNRSTFPYSLCSVRVELVRRATFLSRFSCPLATALTLRHVPQPEKGLGSFSFLSRAILPLKRQALRGAAQRAGQPCCHVLTPKRRYSFFV